MTWIQNNYELALGLLGEHLAITLPAIILALLLSVPLGWIAHRNRQLGGTLLSGFGLLYAVPSLAMFIIIPVILNLEIRSIANIVVVLTIYGVAVFVRSCADAFDSVPDDVRLSADACGYSPIKRFWAIDLPLALPVIIAGLRVMAVSTISLATVGSVIGIQSLGTLFTDGFQRGIVPEVVTGLILTVLLALAVDGICVLAGKALTPWRRAER